MIDESYGILEGKNDMASNAKYDWKLVKYDQAIIYYKFSNF